MVRCRAAVERRPGPPGWLCAVRQALLILLVVGLIGRPGDRAHAAPREHVHLTATFRDADGASALLVLAQLGGVNIVIPDGVQGMVTVVLQDADPEEALRAVAHALRLELVGHQRSQVLQVVPR